MANSAPLMVWRCDPVNQCTYVNEQWIKFTGRPLEENLGYGWLKNLHPQDRQRCKMICTRAIDARKPFTLEYRLRRFDGEYRTIVDTGVPWHQQDGRFAGYVDGDVTERKQAEQAMQRSEEFSRVVMNSLREQVAIIDSEGKILVINEAWQQGASTPNTFPLIRAATGSNYRDVCRRLARSGDGRAQTALGGIDSVLNGSRDNFSMEYRCDSLGGPTWFLMDVVPLRRAGGGAVISHTNITDQKRQNLDAQESRNELAHMRRVLTIGELGASLAHELNQPLTAIMTNAQAAVRILKSPSPDLVEMQEILKDVIADDKRAGEVIRRMRVLLKKKDLEFGPLQLNKIINEVAEILRATRFSGRPLFDSTWIPTCR